MLRLVLISDTHGKHDELGKLSGDVLIHCGDFCRGFLNKGAEIPSLDRWFAKQDFQCILCIGGNHDFAAQEAFANRGEVFANAVYLQDQEFNFQGTTFYGSPWLPDLTGWAYYLPDADRMRKWELIPRHVDIMITHTPPFGILDKPRSGRNVGCRYLRAVVDRIAPKVHCFGHVHASAGQLATSGTSFINASVVNSDYEVRHRPTVLEIEIDPASM